MLEKANSALSVGCPVKGGFATAGPDPAGEGGASGLEVRASGVDGATGYEGPDEALTGVPRGYPGPDDPGELGASGFAVRAAGGGTANVARGYDGPLLKGFAGPDEGGEGVDGLASVGCVAVARGYAGPDDSFSVGPSSMSAGD